MINNPIPLVRITSVSTATANVTDFVTTYSQPIVDKFYLDFNEAFVSNYNTTEFTRSTDTTIPMLTRTGGNVRADMISRAISLKKFGIMPMIGCNPYRFRMIRLYDPDRVIFADCLPVSAGPTTVTVPAEANATTTPAQASAPVEASVKSEPTTTTDIAELTF